MSSDENLKPDAAVHKKNQNMGTTAKKTKLPGQMYVPSTCHDESDFVGEKGSKESNKY